MSGTIFHSCEVIKAGFEKLVNDKATKEEIANYLLGIYGRLGSSSAVCELSEEVYFEYHTDLEFISANKFKEATIALKLGDNVNVYNVGYLIGAGPDARYCEQIL
jgi:Zn-dependent M16 (insulinase) family peptidase